VTCIEGFPTTTFCRISLLVAGGNTMMPFALPMAVFASMRLLVLVAPDSPIPKLGIVPVEYPFPLVSFHRSELLLPCTHMPPHAAAGVPFLTDTLPSTLIPAEVGPIRIPDKQLVETVTPCTHPGALARNRMPSPRKR